MYRSMTFQEKQRERARLEKSVKYNMFNTFDSSENIDELIIDLPEKIFCRLITEFKNRIEYFDAITSAESYVSQGLDIPEALWNKIQKSRAEYTKYMSRFRNCTANEATYD